MSHVSLVRTRHLLWLPAALLVSIGLLSAAGVPVVPNGTAASATGSTNISATVLPEISLDLAQTNAGAGACGTYVSGTGGTNGNEVYRFGDPVGVRVAIPLSATTTLGTCDMTFGTNNGSSGASLSYKSARVTTAARTLCTVVANGNCDNTAGNYYFNDDDGTNTTIEAGKFGVLLTGSSVCQTRAMTASTYYGAPLSSAAAQNVCTGEAADATATNDGYAQVSFVVNSSGTQQSGNYNAQLDFTATAN